MEVKFIDQLEADQKSNFTLRKKNNQIVADGINSLGLKASWLERLVTCAVYSEFILTNLQNLRTKRVILCKTRICPVCSLIRSRQSLKRLLTRSSGLTSDSRFIHLTLTVPNCEITELKVKVNQMAESWKRLQSSVINKNPAILGFVRSLETTRNSKDNTAHPHYHVLLHVKPMYFSGDYYVTRARWLNMWRKSMRDESITQVDVRAVKNKKGSFLEVSKYDLKAEGMGDLAKMKEGERERLFRWLFEYTEQLKRVRKFSSSGSLKLPKLEDCKQEEDPEGEEIIAYFGAVWGVKNLRYRVTWWQSQIKEFQETVPALKLE